MCGGVCELCVWKRENFKVPNWSWISPSAPVPSNSPPYAKGLPATGFFFFLKATNKKEDKSLPERRENTDEHCILKHTPRSLCCLFFLCPLGFPVSFPTSTFLSTPLQIWCGSDGGRGRIKLIYFFFQIIYYFLNPGQAQDINWSTLLCCKAVEGRGAGWRPQPQPSSEGLFSPLQKPRPFSQTRIETAFWPKT